MKFCAKPILAILLVCVCSAGLFAQQSDYQIKEEFKERYATLESELRTAANAAEIDSLIMEVDSLDMKFTEHSELLNSALYPENYTREIGLLKEKGREIQQRLLVIENKNEKLAELNKEITSFRGEIKRLNKHSDSLRQEILASQESEKRLAGLVKRYRQSMQERDKFILDVVDSLLIAYEGLSPQKTDELTNKMQAGKIENDENPLVIINTIIDNNIETLKRSNKSFTTEDYLRMYAVQKRFNEAWNDIGDGLVRIYGGENRVEWSDRVESKLEEWRASASMSMWASLDTYLENNKFDLSAFDNSYSFFLALDNFVKESKKSSQKKMMTSGNYDKFQKFNQFWNTKIKNEWSRYVQEGEVLTMHQISSIDSEMTTWRDEAKPRSWIIPILLGVSLLAIVGLVIVLFRK
ncbi:MAG: hypothetical protein FH748_01840 [Balneolaceae bacterium]|nr:hypothetical protein [Balneolaceae bacterium]